MTAAVKALFLLSRSLLHSSLAVEKMEHETLENEKWILNLFILHIKWCRYFSLLFCLI